MLLATLQNVVKHYGAQTVLQGVSLEVSTGQKLGLIGPNGSGKTTVLRILLGQEPPSDGTVVVARGVRLGYVPQYVEYDEDQTVLDHVLAEHRQLSHALRVQEERLAGVSEAEMNKALRAYQRARDAYDRIGGDHFPQRAQAMLDALGLVGRGDQRIASLSGGERNVLSLTGALLAEPDLLVLDEPANHLDYVGVAWLEEFLSKFRGAVLVVSHSRYLLDRVVEGILHLENGQVQYYGGGYSTYRATRLRQLLAQQADYVANQKRLSRLEALVARFAQIASVRSDPAWGKRLRARRSQLERENRQAVEKPTLNETSIRADFSTEPTRANIALQVRGYTKAFGELRLFDDAHMEIGCGQRVALVGPNGSGKTALLRDVIAHGAWDHPVMRIGPSLSVGYGAQEQDLLRSDRTVLDEMMATARMTRREAIGLLARFLFPHEDHEKRVGDLSGGERNRLQLAKLMVLRPNFLILDEPTNHLDITAREAVEEALEDFEGTLLVVSHDRYFLDKIADRVVEVRDRKLVSYTGNFTDFWYARQELAARTTGRIATRRKDRKHRAPGRVRRKASADLEKRITETEREKQEIEARMADALARGDHRGGRRTGRQLEQLKARLDDLYQKWVEEEA